MKKIIIITAILIVLMMNMATNLSANEQTNNSPFLDLAVNHWAYKQINDHNGQRK